MTRAEAIERAAAALKGDDGFEPSKREIKGLVDVLEALGVVNLEVSDVRCWHIADIERCPSHVLTSGVTQTSRRASLGPATT